MWKGRSAADYASEVRNNGYTILRGFIATHLIDDMAHAFQPLIDTRIARGPPDRGPSRYYTTLPFSRPFAEESLYAHPFLLQILKDIIGENCVMCQLAADTPLLGSTNQPIHRDAAGLFADIPGYVETPPYQLAFNFPLCDILDTSIGPLEISKNTHMLTSKEQDDLIASGNIELEPVLMKKGDALIRDVRALHRGTPNVTETPRPMVVIGYSCKWLRRPEVGISIPQSSYDSMGSAARNLLRFEAVVPDDADMQYDGVERYDAAVLTQSSGKSINIADNVR
mmetsp:Transcript_15893/g.23936  ORF Transcript_15893/g.23936 Transcript_15893/m.23936 type:complete len:282 (-) Transcript_15893:26-871(-)